MLSARELAAVRQIEYVIRLGITVRQIEADRIKFERGEIRTGPEVLHVDCTAVTRDHTRLSAIEGLERLDEDAAQSLSPGRSKVRS